MRSWSNLFITGLLCSFLSACGGSGSDSPASPAPTNPSTPPSISIQGPETAVVGDSVDFVVAAPVNRRISTISWQVTGLTQQPLASHTQAIGFDVPSSGDYTIDVQATLDNGVELTDSMQLSVSEDTSPIATVRLGHETSEGGRVSLRVDLKRHGELSVANIQWRQVGGPAANAIDFDDGAFSYNIFFQAPRVTTDSIIDIEATITLSNGQQVSDVAQVLVKDIAMDANGFFVNDDGGTLETVSSHMQPYRADSPYANALSQCVYNNTVDESCRFSTLPLIGQVTENPTIDDILDRTYVSHPWMGDAFKQFLETSDSQGDMLDLLRATTAVVISYEVRPSFYWVATGAIYLDANNFWRTPEERDTLNTRPDYRSNFGNDLNFTTTWRYVKDGAYYFPILTSFNAADRLPRTNNEVEAALTWLLYHELAHANDFFDYTEWASLSSSESPLSAYNDAAPISTGLTSALPLTSAELHALADVRYGGVDPTSTQRTYTARQVADWFEEDGAVSFYSYFTEREDIATLFERFMMLYRLNVDSDVGVFTQEAIDNGTTALTWGQRNRVNDDKVKQRINYAVTRIFPHLNVPEIQNNLPSPLLLPEGVRWRDTASFGTQSANSNSANGTLVSGFVEDGSVSDVPANLSTQHRNGKTISVAEEFDAVKFHKKR
ncbi:hypothetical protein KUL42_16460 [Alteromonas sp. KUL42]|uniref:hypothetical protein n=1 Tax=Alteromonas sp. KUL42 TaxID=2480797 RepID=UPI0010FFC223|nr:hypothetical protein [Alteromonas sp. KUL42]GEA06885.1 hypothetical protein KUL42_16460 [Alteromonas sp. KUL42]